MKIQISTLVSLLCLGALPLAQAADFDDTARVLNVSPQTEQYNQPQQECRTEYIQAPQQQQQRGIGGSIVGGVAGAVLGNQIGGGTGRTAATALGAITGAVVGDRLENNNNNNNSYYNNSPQPVQQCRTVDRWQTRNNGYAVTYDYRGHTYTTVMPYDPGDRIRVRVSVTPLNQRM